ncbi:alpha/beta hydrolase [Microbacterium sp. ARD32]|uniref:alpha/beta hydrolase n=1 Tax=Microbacterium sp. ARD32 TaxID=2962577 RepID=UPI002880FC90|nr:alpha/beta hydrolase [Microbacterium sp. ARD32]MDT0157886.1 alpha/beta hydrolase [Microbacterium sp. ARD32]
MSSGVEITSGGAISVDSEAFRAVGRQVERLSWELVCAIDLIRRAEQLLGPLPGRSRSGWVFELSSIEFCLEGLARQAGENAANTQLMADVFELVELRTEQEVRGVGDRGEAITVQARIDALIASDPRVEPMAARLVEEWEKQRFEGLTDQPWDTWLAAGGLATAMLVPAFLPLLHLTQTRPVGKVMGELRDLAVTADRGVLPVGTKLQGVSPAVQVTKVASGATTPVASLKDSIARVPYEHPGEVKGQVVVEKYTMPDSSTRYLAYIDGTRELMPGTDEPFDGTSDWRLYMERHAAASHQAVLQALKEAGADPGDAVDLVGYSQGAMIASHIAMDSPYEVGTLIVAGDPVDPALRSDQTLVRLENGADPVNALATGGAVGGTGAPDSFTVHRDSAMASPIDPHLIDPYIQTAQETDASNDVRVRDWRERYFGELGKAVTVERMEFSAKRL